MADVAQAFPNQTQTRTLTLTDSELRLIRQSLLAYLAYFSHDEGDVTHGIKSLIVKLHEYRVPGDPRNVIVYPSGRRLIL